MGLLLTFALVGLFNWYIFSYSYTLPDSINAIAVDDVAPEFTLLNQEGQLVSLSDYKGKKVVLVFYRGDWWPFCLTELQGLQSRLSDIRQAEAEIVAICVDSVQKNANVAKNMKLDFPILSDPELKAIDAFGLHHEGAYSMNDGDIARPGVYILDRNGVVRWRALTENWRIRVRPETVLKQLAEIP